MEYLDLWPTTVASGKFDTGGLVEYIFANYDLNNLKSESSGYNMFDDNSDIIQAFRKQAYDRFDEYLKKTINKGIDSWGNYTLKSWITGHGKDYSMTIHNHSGAQLSAVFYILAEDNNNGGDIVFTDPRLNANRGYDDKFSPMFDRFRHTPRTGDFMIFPSFAYHHVNPYYSELRICVPVDLFLHNE